MQPQLWIVKTHGTDIQIMPGYLKRERLVQSARTEKGKKDTSKSNSLTPELFLHRKKKVAESPMPKYS